MLRVNAEDGFNCRVVNRINYPASEGKLQKLWKRFRRPLWFVEPVFRTNPNVMSTGTLDANPFVDGSLLEKHSALRPIVISPLAGVPQEWVTGIGDG